MLVSVLVVSVVIFDAVADVLVDAVAVADVLDDAVAVAADVLDAVAVEDVLVDAVAFADVLVDAVAVADALVIATGRCSMLLLSSPQPSINPLHCRYILFCILRRYFEASNLKNVFPYHQFNSFL